MFPALRLGYMVVPNRLLPAVADVLSRLGPRAALIAQPVLARFMAEGSFATHIRRMRRLYAERQKALRMALRREARGLLSAEAETGGMHLIATPGPRLASHLRDTDLARAARAADLAAAPLSGFYAGTGGRQGLVLGYAAFDPDTLSRAVARLAGAISGTGTAPV